MTTPKQELLRILSDITEPKTPREGEYDTVEGNRMLIIACQMVNGGHWSALVGLEDGPYAWVLTHPAFLDAKRCRMMVEYLVGGDNDVLADAGVIAHNHVEATKHTAGRKNVPVSKSTYVDAVRRQERERAATICERMRPHGGRAWSEGQQAAHEALSDAARIVRSPNVAGVDLEPLPSFDEHSLRIEERRRAAAIAEDPNLWDAGDPFATTEAILDMSDVE